MRFVPFFPNLGKLTRRSAIALTIAAASLAVPALAPVAAVADTNKAQEIATHFAQIKTMAGDFVQFGPRGDQSGGKFYIERPGKVRFNYDAPSPIRVISDGRSLVIGNKNLGTWDLYPLSKTPLAILLGETIDLTGAMVKNIKQAPDLVTIVLGDKNIFGDSTITMMFDPNTDDLRQWTITDPQGKETSVMIYNVQAGLKFDDGVFRVPYDQIREGKK